MLAGRAPVRASDGRLDPRRRSPRGRPRRPARVSRRKGSRSRIPNGQVIGLRFSPDGRRIAFIEASGPSNFALGCGGPRRARRRSCRRDGKSSRRSRGTPATGEIWFSGRRAASASGVVELHAVTLAGPQRLVAQTPQLLIVEDIGRDGRVLARSDDWPETMMCLPPGASREVNLTWLDFSEGAALSADGQDLLFIEGGAAQGATGGVYMRKTDGSTPAVRLGDGWTVAGPLARQEVGRAGRWRNRLDPASGRTGRVEDDPGQGFRVPKRALVSGRQEASHRGDAAPARPRVYVRDLGGGRPARSRPREPRRDAALTRRNARRRCRPKTRSGPSTRSTEESPARCRASGRTTVIGFDDKRDEPLRRFGSLPIQIDRLDLATGKRTLSRRSHWPIRPGAIDLRRPADAGRQELLLQLRAQPLAALRHRRTALIGALHLGSVDQGRILGAIDEPGQVAVQSTKTNARRRLTVAS